MTPEFNAWWDEGFIIDDNPYAPASAAFWAWEGWQAGMKAAQQPLTEDGIKRAFSQAGLFEPGDELVEYELDIVRAVERAHGIIKD